MFDSFLLRRFSIIFIESLFLFTLLILFIPTSHCLEVSVSPDSICCGNSIEAIILITNNGDATFDCQIEIAIEDPMGQQNRVESFVITLHSQEKKVVQKNIRPVCTSFGSYKVIVTLTGVNAYIYQTASAPFSIVGNCESRPKDNTPKPKPKSPGCTWTFICDNNVVKRLCVDQNGKEYWKEYDNCNNYNPPRECINGVCVDTTTPGGSDQPKQTCNQQVCQGQNRPIGTSYTKNGLQYQKYMECSCVNNQCKCEEVEKPDQKQPSCDNCQSGPIGETYIKDGLAYQKYQECTCIDGKCNCKSVEKEVPCKGAISGYVYDVVMKSPISNAKIFFCQGYCGPSSYSDASGYFSAGGSCPSINTYVDCDAEGYKSDNLSVTTDGDGNARIRFDLEPIKVTYKIQLLNEFKEYEFGDKNKHVFHKDSTITIEVSPKPNSKLTYLLIRSKTGKEYGSISDDRQSFSWNIGDNSKIVIGKYYIKIKETNDRSEEFYIIFNPFKTESGTLSEDDVNNFWRSPFTKVYTSSDHFDEYYTGHLNNIIFDYAIEASDKVDDNQGTVGDPESLNEYETIQNIIDKVLKNTNEHVGASPPEDKNLENMISTMTSGAKIDADCDVYSLMLVSLFRSVGIPSKLVCGKYGLKFFNWEQGHAWIEAYIPMDKRTPTKSWIVIDAPRRTMSDIGQSYISKFAADINVDLDNKIKNGDLGARFVVRPPKTPSQWIYILDESGKDRKNDYST
jgi:hypothetical protein